MSDTRGESLADRVATLQERIKELRRAGDPAALLAGTKAAADEIEHRIGESPNEAEREALTAVKRLTFNAAADCWPGWSIPVVSPDLRSLVAALELAQRSVRLVEKLGLGRLHEGTGIWLSGAFELALGRYADASRTFAIAREHFIAAKAPGLALLVEGYVAIVRRVGGNEVPAGAEELNEVYARIAAGSFEDGAEWIEQLRTALKVFTR